MPTQLQQLRRKPEAATASRSTHAVGIWAICVGLAACATAAFIYALSGDGVGASLTLASAAGLIYAVLHSVSQPQG